MPSSLTGILAWLQVQAGALFANLSDIASNRPEPARLAVAYTLMTVAVIVILFKIIKKISK